jgi:hypothetical protein
MIILAINVPVAQRIRAVVYGTTGRGFESLRVRLTEYDPNFDQQDCWSLFFLHQHHYSLLKQVALLV